MTYIFFEFVLFVENFLFKKTVLNLKIGFINLIIEKYLFKETKKSSFKLYDSYERVLSLVNVMLISECLNVFNFRI